MHQTVGNVPRTLLYSNPPRTVDNAAGLIDQVLSTAMHAMRTNIHTILKGHVFKRPTNCRLASKLITRENNSQ